MPDGIVYEEYRGARDLVYAEVTVDTNDEINFGEIKKLAGLRTVSKETESSSDTKFYDNVPAIIIESQGADTINLSVSVLTLKTQADITGQDYDETTESLIEGERKQKYFAIGYVVKTTSGSERYVWRYKGTFSLPSSEHQTEDNGTDSTNVELTYTGINTTHKFQKGNKTAKGIVSPSNKMDEIKFFESVITPDSLSDATKTQEVTTE